MTISRSRPRAGSQRPRAAAAGQAPAGRARLVVGTLGCLTAYAALVGSATRAEGRSVPAGGLVGLWVVCLGLTWWVTRRELGWRRTVLAVVISAAAVQLPGVLTPPITSTDAYRYVWDGRVQLSGTSPYRYAPLDDRLAGLRDPVLFAGLTAQQRSGVLTQPVPTNRDDVLRLAADDPRTLINRPNVPTIYPPVAQGWFAAVALVTPWSWGTLGQQVGSALVAVALAGLLAAWRRRHGGRPSDALWWAWCPTVLLEAGNGAHIDIVAAALVVGALVVALSQPARRWTSAAAGGLLGLAASVKLTPLVLVPALACWRHGWRSALPAPLAAALAFGATYVPHLLAAGWLVTGYLPGYVMEEGGVNRAGVLGFVVPPPWRQAAAVSVLAVAVLWTLVRATRGPAILALTLYGVLLLTTTPTYPWYALPLVALAVLAGRLEWLAVAFAGQVALVAVLTPPVPAIGYAVAGLVVAGAAITRGRAGARLVLSRVGLGAPNGQGPVVPHDANGIHEQADRRHEAKQDHHVGADLLLQQGLARGLVAGPQDHRDGDHRDEARGDEGALQVAPRACPRGAPEHPPDPDDTWRQQRVVHYDGHDQPGSQHEQVLDRDLGQQPEHPEAAQQQAPCSQTGPPCPHVSSPRSG